MHELPPPGAYPRFATLSDVLRIFSGDRATHAVPPGTHWTWLGFPESWPLVSCNQGNYTGPGTPLGNPDDLWWFTLAELAEHQPDAIPAWLAQLLVREVAEYTGALAAAFIALGSVPLLWTVPNYPEPRMLAYQPHYRLAFGGSLFVVEQWVCRLNITSSGALMTEAEADAALPAVVAACSTFVSTNGWFGGGVHLEYVKLNKINSLGHYDNPSAARTAMIDPAVAGAGGPSTFPPQVALCASLLTAHSRGKAHRGRIYLPALVGALISSGPGAGLIGGGASGAIRDATHAFIQAVNAALPTPNAVSVISGTGEANHVTGVAIGTAYDTQRRRRRSMTEAPYITSALDL